MVFDGTVYYQKYSKFIGISVGWEKFGTAWNLVELIDSGLSLRHFQQAYSIWLFTPETCPSDQCQTLVEVETMGLEEQDEINTFAQRPRSADDYRT